MPNHATIILAGHLGRDAEVRSTTTGKTITSWSLAVKTGWGDNTQTTWYSCNLWGGRGPKIQPHLINGKPVMITGEPSMRTYEGRDGTPKVTIEVNVRDVVLLGDRQQPDEQQVPSQGDLQEGVPF